MDRHNKIMLQAREAKAAALQLALVPSSGKDRALRSMAMALWAGRGLILRANLKDLSAGKAAGLSSAMLDRLTLDDRRIKAMADGILDIVKLKDPVGQMIASWKRPNGLRIDQVRVPIGVVGIIYESRPNVTSDCAALCIKSGNAVILRGGKEAIHSNRAIYRVLKGALGKGSVPTGALQLVGSTDRAAVTELLQLDSLIDLIVPRGGEGLIRFVAENSRIPVVKHYKGVCHVYVGAKADLKMAEEICFNAKVQRPGVCNAMEKMLVDARVARKFLPVMLGRFRQSGVQLRGDQATRRIDTGVAAAREQDWSEEYLDLVLAIKVVKNVREAVDHINKYGSRHSDAIVTRDPKDAEAFLKGVDSACVYVNASTRFTDGFEFGLGAEVGISTDKLHVRGPMGLEGLTSYKYEIHGNGQIRK
ncbi:MAG: glutamate-5-semialdehyde dehydrogenase [Candidatus Omnitrophica bacterium]|nr:glutamate-5-semialdehyde dehydrogenase [Candidatus Omnitrophota bacterium]